MPVEELHTVSLAAVLERDFGVPAVIWDRATLPLESKMGFRIGLHGEDLRLGTRAGTMHPRISIVYGGDEYGGDDLTYPELTNR